VHLVRAFGEIEHVVLRERATEPCEAFNPAVLGAPGVLSAPDASSTNIVEACTMLSGRNGRKW
jgi:hypothetical protein